MCVNYGLIFVILSLAHSPPSSPMSWFLSCALHQRNERTNERTKKDFTIYDGGDEQRTSASERAGERASEEELKVSHNTTKVKDGFPQCGPTSVSDIGSLLGYVALQVAN